MSKYHKRILKDIKDVMVDSKEQLKENGIWCYFDEDNFTEGMIIIEGQPDTPYEGYIFIFKVTIPIDGEKIYPVYPPKVESIMVDTGFRYHPNIYPCGKVCLSILGTWSGPIWTCVMNLRILCISLASLFDENPIAYEPSYNNVKITDCCSVNYNLFIRMKLYEKWMPLLYTELMKDKYKFYLERFKTKLRSDLNIREKTLNIMCINDTKNIISTYGYNTIINYNDFKQSI